MVTGEADIPDEAENPPGAARGSAPVPVDRFTRIERTLERIIRALGMADGRDGEAPDLTGAVTDLMKRLDDLERILDTDAPP